VGLSGIDVIGHDVDVALITETQLKAKHDSDVFGIDGYTLIRRDRSKRCGGGIILYVRTTLNSMIWTARRVIDNVEIL